MRILGLAVLFIIAHAVRAANILALNLVLSHSHTIYSNTIVRALAARGHKVVVLSPDKETRPNPNITTIHVKCDYESVAMTGKSSLEDLPPSKSFSDFLSVFQEYSINGCKSPLFSAENKKFFREYKNYKFDLIIVDISNECFIKYAHVFGHPPVVALSAFLTIHPHILGDIDDPSYVPHFLSDLDDRMTFTDRFRNWFYYHYFAFTRWYRIFPVLDEMAAEFFGFSEPTIHDLEKEIAMVLTDEHFSISHPKPTVPAVVQVAGLHIKPAKPLPKEMDDFVSGATHGVIYFSLGSNFLSKHLTNERKQMFLQAFSQLPQRILWKYEDEQLQNIPENVLVQKWFPQTDILGHKNTVLFITHNGYLSTQESIYFGVPMLGIPLIYDQFKNNAKVVKSGLGLGLRLREIRNSEEIVEKITSILRNPSFKGKVQRLSNFFRDRPMSPLDTAIYWIEYVLRHKNADQLKVASLDLTWYQYHLLDIYLTIAAFVFVVLYVFAKLIRALLPDGEKKKTA